MKNIFYLLFTLSLIFFLACGDNLTNDLPNNSEEDELKDKITIASINFKDSNLHNCILESNKTYAVELTSLECNQKNIEFLDGIQHFTNLTELQLSTNRISNLSHISKLTKLHFINLKSNLISDISPLRSLNQLSQLGLPSNLIVDLSPIEKLISITNIGLSSNQINSITPILGLSNITKLSISDNPLSTISGINKLSNLTSLALDSVKLVDEDLLEITTMSKIVDLKLANNQLSNVDLIGNLNELVFLVLNRNNIVDVCKLKSLVKLQALWLQDNQIISGVDCLKTLVNIEAQFKIVLESNSNLNCDQVDDLRSALGELKVKPPSQCTL